MNSKWREILWLLLPTPVQLLGIQKLMDTGTINRNIAYEIFYEMIRERIDWLLQAYKKGK